MGTRKMQCARTGKLEGRTNVLEDNGKFVGEPLHGEEQGKGKIKEESREEEPYE